jgi:acyl transferase domain-containing protein
MLAVDLGEDEAAALAGPDAALAAVNAPRRCVLAGTEAAIAALAAMLAGRGVAHRRLVTSHAYHSPMMEPAAAALAGELRVTLSPPRIPFLSNVTGTWIRDEEATDPGYWSRHVRATVRFDDGLRQLLRLPGGVLLEVGPGRSMSALVRRHPERQANHLAVASLPRDESDAESYASLLGALGAMWTAGVEADWTRLHEGERRRRVSLPTYPFERRRCWIGRREEPGAERTAAMERADRARRREIGEWFYLPSWRRTLPLETAVEPAGGPSRWLVLADDLGVGAWLAGQLAGAVTVRPGARFARTGERSYSVDPRDPASFVSLLDEVAEPGGGQVGIVHLWTLAPVPETASAADLGGRLEALQPIGPGSLVALVRAAARRGLDDRLRLELVTNGLQEVTGEEPLAPEKATLLGPLTVVPQEHPGARCRAIDLHLGGATPPEQLARAVLAEIRGQADEPLVAYRGRHRWVRSYAPLPTASGAGSVRLREQGVYLITGGLGGIGLTLAAHLAGSVRARLALLGRSPLPEPALWPSIVAAAGVGASVPRRLREVEAAGGRVLTLVADVTRPEEVRAALSRVRRELGPLNGVIHAAGVAGGGLLQARLDEEGERVLAPKVRGTLNLAAALAGEELDFFLLCSSTLALTGGVGQGDYCAANSFLDAFALQQSRGGLPVLSVSWDQWSRVGMAARRHPGAAAASSHPLLGRRVPAPAAPATYLGTLSATRHWVLDEHRILGRPVLPGSALLELIAAAAADATEAGPDATLTIRDAAFLAPLAIDDGEEREVRAVVERTGDESTVRVLAREGAGGAWREHASARVSTVTAPEIRRHDLPALLARLGAAGPEGKGAVAHGGPHWQCLRRIGLFASEAVAELILPDGLADDLPAFRLHPALLDVATSFALRHAAAGSFLPVSYERLTIHGRLPARLISHVRAWQGGGPGDGSVRFDLALIDEDGAERAEIQGFTLRRLDEARRETVPAAAPLPAAGDGAEGVDGGGGILPAEGVEAFRRILALPASLAQVVVATRDLDALIEAARVRRPPARDAWRAAERPKHERPHLSSPYVMPRTPTERTLAAIEGDLLGIEQVGIHDNFFELGGDSMLGVQLFARATQAGLKLTAGTLFQSQTIAELAAAADGAREAAAPEPAAGAVPGSPPPAEPPDDGRAASPTVPADGGGILAEFGDAEISQDDLEGILARYGTAEQDLPSDG